MLLEYFVYCIVIVSKKLFQLRKACYENIGRLNTFVNLLILLLMYYLLIFYPNKPASLLLLRNS